MLRGYACCENGVVLLQTEIDGSCQTKVSVPVNTELYIIVPVRQKSRYNQLSLY